jgi:hypothetical protein
MTLSEARYHLIRQTKRRELIFAADALLWALAIASLAFVTTSLLSDSILFSTGIAVAAGSLAFYRRALRLGYFEFDERIVARLINEQNKQYEDSADLLLDPGSELT